MFDCFLCDQEVGANRYREHMKRHMEEVEAEGEELRGLVEGFAQTCERVNATMGSFLSLSKQQSGPTGGTLHASDKPS